MNVATPLSNARRWTLIGVGCLCVAVGTVGIVVPGLPTTVFLLIASWAFLQSSPRLHRKLHAHPRLGAYLRLARERSLPVRVRVASLVGIWGGIALSLTVGGVSTPWLVAVLVAAGAVGSVVVLTARRRRTTTGYSGLRA